MLRIIDDTLQQILGLPYLYVTRDYLIHARCGYLLHKLQRAEG